MGRNYWTIDTTISIPGQLPIDLLLDMKSTLLVRCDAKPLGLDKNGKEIKTNWHRLVENLENNPDFFISTKTNMLYYVQI